MSTYTNSLFITLILGLVLLTPASLLAQDWEFSNGSSTVSGLNEVQFMSTQMIYAVGNTGTILKSTDGGQTWSDISYETTKNIQTLYFFDENTGFVGTPFMSGGGGSSEMLAKTTDGGTNWEVLSSFDFDDFNDLEFLDAQNGWAASVDGKVLYTTDGGESWSSSSAGSEDLVDVEIIDANTLWVAGDYASLHKSTDGGQSWNSAIQLDTITVGEMQFLSSSDHINDVEFLDENTGYLIGDTYDSGYKGFLLKTTDGGQNWTAISSDSEHKFTDIEITESGTIVIAAGNDDFSEAGGNAIYISEDDGDSWKVLQDGSGPISWNDLDYLEDSWVAVGASGAITTFTLTDDTLHSDLLTGQTLSDLDFFDENNGAFVTKERYEGKIFTTSDGGQTWTKRFTLEGRKDFESVAFADADNLWAVGNDHYTGDEVWLIYHSDDQGQSWTKVDPGLEVHEQLEQLEQVQLLDAQTGFIKAEDQLLKTTDGGSSWTPITEPESISYYDFETIQFLDEQNGFMAGTEQIAKTSDGGASWEIVYEQDSMSPEITNVQFISTSLGYVTQERGNMMKTTDGGETWTELSTFSSFDLNDLHFISSDTGYVVADGGRILTTVDGGNEFETNYGLTSKDLTTVYFTNKNMGWIGGREGTLLSTTNGGGIATSNEIKEPTDAPVSVSLHQNYPNPFNPSTVISYQLPVSSEVELRVFDMLGREVATLVNSQQTAGEHSVTFDASNLSSGIYLYQLQTGETSITKKLTLIK